MQDFADEPVFVFHRVVGAGDEAIMQALHAWFPVIGDYEHEFPSLAAYRAHPLDEEMLSSLCLMAGFWNRDEDRPEIRYPRLFKAGWVWRFTMLSDPFDMAARFYARHIAACRTVASASLPSFKEFYLQRPNPLAKRLGIECEAFEEDLARYAFIGQSLEIERSLEMLRSVLLRMVEKWPSTPNLSRLRRRLEMPLSSGWNRPSYSDEDEILRRLPERTRVEFQESNPLDYRIWQTAAARHFSDGSLL